MIFSFPATLLGFLYSEEAGIHGNMGLFDQLEALRWTKQYIHNFGGDPENVTVFGESAGAISISTHLVSPLAKGLFSKAICESGTVLYPGGAMTRQQANKYYANRLKDLGVGNRGSLNWTETE